MAIIPIRTRLQQLVWYRQKHGVPRFVSLALRKLTYRWVIRSEYLFGIDLLGETFSVVQRFDPIVVESYSSMETISSDDLQQLSILKGRAIALPFLEDFFARGARLWLGKDKEKIVGLKWTLRGGFSGFYSMPISNTDVISVAEEVFQEFRGEGLWQRFTAGVLPVLKAEGVSRVYFKVHCRNRSMLKAVKKAGIPMLGRVITLSFPGCYLTVWDKRFLKRGGDNWPISP